jgi:uncharacterized protein YcfL
MFFNFSLILKKMKRKTIVVLVLLLLIACTSSEKENNEIKLQIIGFNIIRIELAENLKVQNIHLFREEVVENRALIISKVSVNKEIKLISESRIIYDTVPITFGEIKYAYFLKDAGNKIISSAYTSNKRFPRELIPKIYLPGKPEWDTIYYKAWDLTWQRMVSSDSLPSRFAYNDYPDNRVTYVWDALFCSLFQRYAAVFNSHPGMATIGNFYIHQHESGYIPRNYNCVDFKPRWYVRLDKPGVHGVNAALFSFSEWNYYLISGDTNRLKKVLQG